MKRRHYISFGRALGYQEQYGGWVDVHGAGAQRSDPKVPGEEYEFGNGPQGDAVRQYNYVLCVSGGVAEPSDGDDPSTLVLSDVEMEPTEGGDVPTLDDANTQADPGAGAPDLSAAAATLGITEQELLDALGGPPPDFEAAAAALGISAEELEAALGGGAPSGGGAPEGGPPQDGAPPEESSDASQMPADSAETASAAYTITSTGQGFCYNSDGENIACPTEGEAFYGQDAQFTGVAFDFTDNGDGTVTDDVTNLVWEQTPNSGPSSWPEAQDYCESLTLGGQDDWRMPSLKELFSISNFSAGWPYLDTDYFDLTVSDSISKDEQYWADNYYVGKTSEGQYDAAFGVNHATGHIKAYPALVGGPMGKYVRCVIGDEYGINNFVDNGDGTITDNATALTWTQADSGEGMDWESALAYAQEMNAANYLGYSDWCLPNLKYSWVVLAP